MTKATSINQTVVVDGRVVQAEGFIFNKKGMRSAYPAKTQLKKVNEICKKGIEVLIY